ncbi:MAG: AI-2E family transporter [Acidimicrobiales bacterium]
MATQEETGTGVAGLPRGLVVLLTVAAGMIGIAGLKAFSGTVGPMFLAIVVVVVLAPIHGAVARRGAPSWLAMTALLAASLGVIAVILGSVAWAAIELVTLLSGETYESQLSQTQEDLADLADRFGVTGDDLDSVVEGIDLGSVASQLTSALSGVLGVLGTLSVIILMLLFVVMDADKFSRALRSVTAEKPAVVDALRNFASSTRSYFVVATIFGLIVAVFDVVALLIMGIPLALVWGVLSFITNYIPNVGFILGLIPPALLGFFEGGWQLSLWVIVVYSVINVVIQSIIQPKFVGDAVGLSATLTFVSLMFWAWVIGPLGALLAVPLTLFGKALLMDIDPTTQWAAPLISLDGSGSADEVADVGDEGR